MYLGSFNERVWDVTEGDYVTLDPTNLTNEDHANKQCNTLALNTIYNAIDSKVFEQFKDLERASEVWKRLEETYEGTPAFKSAKLHILNNKLISFKMKDEESIPEMFHRLQVIINDLMALGEKVQYDDVSHRFLMCLPPRFETLRLIIIREGLKDITPNQVLGDVMTQETYYVEREGNDKVQKKDEYKKKKSVAFKASTSSKSKGKPKKEESSCDEDASDIDGDAMALFVRKLAKFMKKGYGARKRRDHNKESDDEEEEVSKEALMDMLENAHTCLEMKRKECKELHKRVKSLEQSFDELNATHKRLMEAHEKLGKAHSKLEKAHSSLLEEAKKEEVIVSYFCEEFAKMMANEFEMSMIGELSYLLGPQIKQMKNGTIVSQGKYIKDMLKKFGMDDAKAISTPMGTNGNLDSDANGNQGLK
ncbi:uncharacterized protein [Miscanthus floridulus]|uniref:uncharacterized protein n=1 Tax=Miscanthus floridulus TaxID=154761 RepID=UPI00345963E1